MSLKGIHCHKSRNSASDNSKM